MLSLDGGLRFEQLEYRLLEEVRRRINNGELTERGLARRVGVSQPHIHNILKGLRTVSTPIADLILEELGLGILDLVQTSELGGALELRTARSTRRVHVGIASGRISPHAPFPDLGGADRWVSLPANVVKGARRPVLAEVELDAALQGVFPSPEVALIDTDESTRLQTDPGAWYLIRVDGAGLIRQLRRTANRLVVLGQQTLFESCPWLELELGTVTALQFVRGKVLWMGQDPRRDYLESVPAASS